MLPHLASRLYGAPLLLARSKLDILLAVLGERIDWPETLAALPIPQPRTPTDTPSGLAVIPIQGTLVRRTLGLEAASGMMSYGEIGAMLDAAIADPAVGGILLDVDSPGGEAGGVFELGARIRAADAVKPVWAIASDSAFSAAYALACSASRVYVTQTGGVGSIGVIAMHVDQSVRDAQQGYRYTAIAAGDQKNDFSPHEKLTSEAQGRLQAEVDRLYGLFVDHVAAMRSLEARFVRSTQAALYFGPEAVAAGLADREGSLDQAIADFSAHLLARRVRNAAPQSLTVSAPISKELHMSETTALPDTREADPVETPPAQPQQDAPEDAELVRAEALAIAELCQLAGAPNRIAEFLALGASEAQVRKTLLAARADSIEITSTIAPDAAAARPANVANPLMAAIRKLTGKE